MSWLSEVFNKKLVVDDECLPIEVVLTNPICTELNNVQVYPTSNLVSNDVYIAGESRISLRIETNLGMSHSFFFPVLCVVDRKSGHRALYPIYRNILVVATSKIKIFSVQYQLIDAISAMNMFRYSVIDELQDEWKFVNIGNYISKESSICLEKGSSLNLSFDNAFSELTF